MQLVGIKYSITVNAAWEFDIRETLVGLCAFASDEMCFYEFVL